MRYFALTVVLLLASVFAVAATPLVNNISINYTTNRITINGQNFSNNPVVLFNAVNLAPLVSATAQKVVANLPAGTQPGTYRLSVTNNAGNTYEFDVTFGAVGPQGPIGVQGPQGPQGPAGSTGATGATGVQGPPGAIGPQGPAGPGFKWQGTWQARPTYNANDVVAYNGSSYLAIVTSVGVTPDSDTTKWNLVAQQGATGAQGLQGLTGAIGPQGLPGAVGPAGTSGPAGAVGPAGATGATGAQGVAGPTGPQGSQGLLGPQGPAGVNARGPWNSAAIYALSDIVSDQGETFRCANPQDTSSNTFNFYLSANGVSGNGTFVTSPQSGGTFLITAITGGTLNGAPLTLLPPGTIGVSDNLLLSSPPYFDSVGGVEFKAGDQPEAFFGQNGIAYLCVPGSGNCNPNSATPLNITVIGVTQSCSREPSATNILPTGEWELLAANGAQGPQGLIGATGPIGPQGPEGPTGPQGTPGPAGPTGPAGTADIPSSRSYLSSNVAIPPSADQHSAVLIDWNAVQYDTLGAIQLGPWRYVVPTAGRYRVSTFIRYQPNGLIAAGQLVQVEVYVNGNDYGALGGFQAANDIGGADLFLYGEDEIASAAGDQITINLFQNTGQTGNVTTASHVLVERVGN